jgi:hypothetical protein
VLLRLARAQPTREEQDLTDVDYVMVKASSLRNGLDMREERELSGMHLAVKRGRRHSNKTVCGKLVARAVGGQWEPSEASCRECKRMAGIG